MAGGREQILDAQQLRQVALFDTDLSQLSSDDYRETEPDAAVAGQNLLSYGEHGAVSDTFVDRLIGVVPLLGRQVVGVKSWSKVSRWSQLLVAGWPRKVEMCSTSSASLGWDKLPSETLVNPNFDTVYQ